VNFVSPSVDENTQTVLAKAPLSRPGFRNEQFVRARIVWSTAPSLVIPLTAVMRVSGQYFRLRRGAWAGRGARREAARRECSAPSSARATSSSVV
jgi:multidrug efflux pump subunit AcrA (membrane-fusion protein)